jgi:hypothetical protein
MSLKCGFLEHVTYVAGACWLPKAEPQASPRKISHSLNSIIKSTLSKPLYSITMLCRFCEEFSFKNIWGAHYEHQPSLMSLRASAAQGCELCLIINHALRLSGWQDLNISLENTGVWLEDYKLTEIDYQQRRCLKVFYGSVGNIDSPRQPRGEVLFATNEGSKELTTG